MPRCFCNRVTQDLCYSNPSDACRLSVRTSLIAGGTIAQVGEFSFVLGSRGADVGLLTGDDYQTFLAAAVITMAAAPLLTGVVPRFCDWLDKDHGLVKCFMIHHLKMISI